MFKRKREEIDKLKREVVKDIKRMDKQEKRSIEGAVAAVDKFQHNLSVNGFHVLLGHSMVGHGKGGK